MSRSHAGRIAGLLCVLLLAACLVALLVSLRSAGSPEPKNAAEDNTFGMLLIDIPDDESAAFTMLPVWAFMCSLWTKIVRHTGWAYVRAIGYPVSMVLP